MRIEGGFGYILEFGMGSIGDDYGNEYIDVCEDGRGYNVYAYIVHLTSSPTSFDLNAVWCFSKCCISNMQHYAKSYGDTEKASFGRIEVE